MHADALDHLRRPEGRVDLALLDPPYAFEDWAALLERLDAAIVVIESNRPIDLGERWDVRRERRYGDTVVVIASRVELRPAPDPQEFDQ